MKISYLVQTDPAVMQEFIVGDAAGIQAIFKREVDGGPILRRIVVNSLELFETYNLVLINGRNCDDFWWRFPKNWLGQISYDLQYFNKDSSSQKVDIGNVYLSRYQDRN